MPLNILQSDSACHDCLKTYAKKHNFKKGDKFEIDCKGIPREYISSLTSSQLTSTVDPQILMDPVMWAAQVLDWHCLDPDGDVWARKDPEEYIEQMAKHPGRPSKYHRPYQATMLRCTAKYKVFRLGRQSGKTESLVISMLFQMFTNSKFHVVLITPFQSQIDLIFKRLETLINDNPTLANSVKRSVKAPQYTIELHNGSQVKGFTAGTKSGNGAAAARGQAASMLVFDEADYLDKADLDAAMSIITNYPEATVWMSSTPTGRREKFYETCLDKEWKEYHYPSHVNPNYDDKLESFFRKNLTSIGYKHEVLADFGEQEEGVFQAAFVDRSISEYRYSEMYPQSHWLYSIGVDWNSPRVGTTIYVTGFNQSNNKFYVVEHAVVQRDQHTQLAAMQKIVELHRKWRPFAIYVDQGYGATQIEFLRKYGYDARVDKDRGPNHIDSKLPRVLKPYDFGSAIEIRDPFTKEKRKKPAKGFLVENAVRRFESDDIRIPVEDEQLRKELLAYIVKHVTVTGQVVYSTTDDAIGDHNLDALMLSLVGFTLDKSILGRPIMNEKMSFTPVDGLNPTRAPEALSLPNPATSNVQPRAVLASEQAPSSRDTNVAAAQPTKLWSWPGWGHDAPKPVFGGTGKPSRVIFKRPGPPTGRGKF
jgi:hypothetical protein